MVYSFLCLIISILITFVNINIEKWSLVKSHSRLICVNEYVQFFSFGTNSLIADVFWVRFLQELDIYNELKVAEPHLCPNKTSSWHYHIIKVAMNLDSKFYEMISEAPLLISVTISDSKGASELFDKAVESFPNDWKVLYRASYQAQIEEKNLKKAADLLYRAGKNGAPSWVMSLAGGLYNETGQRQLAETIYRELLVDSKDIEAASRLKLKLENKFQNYFLFGEEDSKSK